jgi:uncharacterized protein YbaR (Trm112 family)
VDESVLSLLCCPGDRGELLWKDDAGWCAACDRRYPIIDGVVCFLGEDELSSIDRRERSSRDTESSWYDSMFEGYTNAVEVPTAIRRIGHPGGVVLDHGAGTGRITAALVGLGQPVIAVDYSLSSLRKLVNRCRDAPVVVVNADLRALPIRDLAIHATTSIEVYEHLRGEEERRQVLCELSRVMMPGAPLSISTFNYNLIYRMWKLLGNQGAREGEHLLGGDFYYIRQTGAEFRRELEKVFDVEELTGIRNIPARTLASLIRRIGFDRSADRFLGWMVERGHRLDFALEKTPLADQVGFFWLARATRRGEDAFVG